MKSKKLRKSLKLSKILLRQPPRRGSISFPNNPPMRTPPLPYPQRSQKKNLDEQFLQAFKKLSINITFVEALQKIPNCIKFMREMIFKKKTLEEYEIVKLIDECSVIL